MAVSTVEVLTDGLPSFLGPQGRNLFFSWALRGRNSLRVGLTGQACHRLARVGQFGGTRVAAVTRKRLGTTETYRRRNAWSASDVGGTQTGLLDEYRPDPLDAGNVRRQASEALRE